MRITLHTLLILVLSITTLHAQSKKHLPDPTTQRKSWVDSIYTSLSQEERICQLFMVAAYSGGKNYNEDQVTKLIDSQKIGGLIFMQGTAASQAVLTNKYQQRSHTPLLIAMDAEWGLGMRLDSVKNFPRQMMLGATRDSALVYRMGVAVAAQCQRLGVNMDFAPDVDVNNNAANPVINSRSFGEDKTLVARLGIAYMKGLQKNHIIACAKHFPGHGDTNVDSHKDLPLISKSLAQLDTLELYPFRRLIANGVKSVMVAHLEVPALDTAAHVPTSLSYNTVTKLLKENLGFTGLVVTDALNMQGVAKYFPAGDADLRAFAAGNDILLFPGNVPAAIVRIKNAIDSGVIPQAMLETSVKKILAAKYDAGLYEWKNIDTANILKDLNKEINVIREQVAKSAITQIRDDSNLIKKLNGHARINYIGINTSTVTPLYTALEKHYGHITPMWLHKGMSADSLDDIIARMSAADINIVAVHNLGNIPGNNYGLTDDELAFLSFATTRRGTIVAMMGNAYATQYVCNAGTVFAGYDDDSLTQLAMADVLMKKLKPKGKMPVTACVNYHSIVPMIPKPVATSAAFVPHALVNSTPFHAGVSDYAALDTLDKFMQANIANGVYPGCRVMAAKDGKVFYNKSFGYYTYDKQQRVDTNTLYDMASCTKVLATTLAVMRLYEQGKLSLDKTLGDYLPITRGTDKASLVIRDILLHQAGLKGWIPFYKETMQDGGPKPELYRSSPGVNYTTQVAQGMYLRNDYIDTMWSRILTSPLVNTGKFVYSDLDFVFLATVVQQITGKRIDDYVEEQFYRPMGLRHITYTPLAKFPASAIAPTENDVSFRRQLLQGYVHDPGAAMFGGIAGHAGIFATAQDVAAIFQMLLNKGEYAGTRYFKASTVDLFTAYHSTISHRGYGFDKPTPDPNDGGPAGDNCSALAFGHQGFTGTCAWADPATGIVFVFLSNRVNPTAENPKINKLNVRTTAQDYIYESLGIPVNHDRNVIYQEEVNVAK